jgi:LruC domain-containing protein
LDIANFNPFIIVNKNRNKEVHLPDYPPTALVNPAFFGTYDDNSIPTSNRYYKTSKNLPWALNIYDTFEYPIEKTPIIEAYPYFVDWVMSDGNQYADWYKDITGYRNMNKIFTPPVSNLKKTIKPDVNKRK